MSASAAFRLLFYTADASGSPAAPADRILRLAGGLLDGTQTADKLNTLAREITAADMPEKLHGEIFEAQVGRPAISCRRIFWQMSFHLTRSSC